MFSKHFQGGGGLELYSAGGSTGESAYVTVQGHGSREYDKTCKGYALILERPGQSNLIRSPISNRDQLSIVQPLLVLQMLLQSNNACSIEIGIQTMPIIVGDVASANFNTNFANNASTTSNSTAQSLSRKRVYLSTAFRDFESNELHVKLPWAPLHRGSWTNFIIDLRAIVQRSFTNTAFHSLEYFVVKPQLRIRKIFTLPASSAGASPMDSAMSSADCYIAPALQFPSGVTFKNYFYALAGEQDLGALESNNGNGVDSSSMPLVRVDGKGIIGQSTPSSSKGSNSNNSINSNNGSNSNSSVYSSNQIGSNSGTKAAKSARTVARTPSPQTRLKASNPNPTINITSSSSQSNSSLPSDVNQSSANKPPPHHPPSTKQDSRPPLSGVSSANNPNPNLNPAATPAAPAAPASSTSAHSRSISGIPGIRGLSPTLARSGLASLERDLVAITNIKPPPSNNSSNNSICGISLTNNKRSDTCNNSSNYGDPAVVCLPHVPPHPSSLGFGFNDSIYNAVHDYDYDYDTAEPPQPPAAVGFRDGEAAINFRTAAIADAHDKDRVVGNSTLTSNIKSIRSVGNSSDAPSMHTIGVIETYMVRDDVKASIERDKFREADRMKQFSVDNEAGRRGFKHFSAEETRPELEREDGIPVDDFTVIQMVEPQLTKQQMDCLYAIYTETVGVVEDGQSQNQLQRLVGLIGAELQEYQELFGVEALLSFIEGFGHHSVKANQQYAANS